MKGAGLWGDALLASGSRVGSEGRGVSGIYKDQVQVNL